MDSLDLFLMTVPQTFFNASPICFPYQKAEALFYYIAVEKIVTRDQAASMFWPDLSDDSGKQNLRQTLYVLNKTFGASIIKSLPNHCLGFSDNLIFRCDLDTFFDKRDLNLYKAEIFSGFSIRNAPNFDEWLFKQREAARFFFLSNFLDLMRNIPPSNLSLIESSFFRYINEDPFDEQPYVILLKAYIHNAAYHKGIQLYQKLCALLKSELGVDPAAETASLYHQLLNSRNPSFSSKSTIPSLPRFPSSDSSSHSSSSIAFLYKAQLKYLECLYREFIDGRGIAVLISGEPGIGKISLFEEFFLNCLPHDSLILNVTCFMKYKNSMLKPWNDLMLQIHNFVSEKNLSLPLFLLEEASRLIPAFAINFSNIPSSGDSNYDFQASINSILQILLIIARQFNLAILFSNIHAMDKLSLDILSSLIHTARQEILVLCTSSDIVDRDTESFISAAHNNNHLTRIHLPPLRFDDANSLLRLNARSASFILSDEQIRDIFSLSQGNLFFINDLLWNLSNGFDLLHFSPRAQDMLNDQLNGLSDSLRNILDIISVFTVCVALDVLKLILNSSHSLTSQAIELLKSRGLIIENILDDKLCLSFRHLRMRDFIYSKIPLSKKRKLHDLVGSACENSSLFPLRKEYHLLIHHFSLAGNHPKALQYKIQKLSNEAFPNSRAFSDYVASIDPNLPPLTFLLDLLCDLRALKASNPDSLDFDYLESLLLLTLCRFYLLSNDSFNGISVFLQLINMPYIWSNSQLLFKAYLHLLDFIILNGGYSLFRSMELLFERIKPSLHHLECAAFHHLKALVAILAGDNDQARFLLDLVSKAILELPNPSHPTPPPPPS